MIANNDENSASSARSAALRILNGVDKCSALVDELLGDELSRIQDQRDRALVQELSYGVLRHRLWLDWCLKEANSGKSLRVSKSVENLLRMGAYQILFCDRIPDYAAVSESVRLCRRSAYDGLSGLVNAVLRNLIRCRESMQCSCVEYADFLSTKYSLPIWIARRLLDIWPIEEVQQFAETSLQPPVLTVRIFPRVISRELFAQQCAEQGIEVEPVCWLENAFLVRSQTTVSELPGFEQGAFQVQDGGAQLVTLLLDPQPGEKILEVGSAPGGKTTDVAERIGDQGRLYAVDVSEKRCKKLRENIEKLGVSNVQVIVADATEDLPGVPKEMDRVLLDAPCSGLGTLRRRVDLKWRLVPENVTQLGAAQRSLLAKAAEYVRPEGVLVYSTCTVLPEENEGVVESFLEENSNWEVESAEPFLPEGVRESIQPMGGFLTLPHRHNVDGIFGIRLRRRS